MSGLTSGLVGIQTQAAQPAVLTFPSAELVNVTGDGTDYTIVYAGEVFDRNSDFDGASTFTAPVTGIYAIETKTTIDGILAAMNNLKHQIITGNRTISMYLNLYAIKDAVSGPATVTMQLLADMDASDTLTILIDIASSSKTVDIAADSHLSVHLVA